MNCIYKAAYKIYSSINKSKCSCSNIFTYLFSLGTKFFNRFIKIS